MPSSLVAEDGSSSPTDTATATQEAFERFVQAHWIGATVEVEVTAVMSFGLALEPAPTVRGFAHMTEITGWPAAGKPSSNEFAVGDRLSERILGVDASHRTISLSLRDVEPLDPFDPAPLHPDDRRRGLEEVAREIRSARPFLPDAVRTDLELQWGALRATSDRDEFLRIQSDIRRAVRSGDSEPTSVDDRTSDPSAR